MKTFYKIIASGFGSGFTPVAPGTAGSIAGCLIIYITGICCGQNFFLFNILSAIFLTFFIVAGMISIKDLEAEWGHDSPQFTVDEIAGMMLAALFVPATMVNLTAAFILFRFFDILKPFWIRQMEKLHGAYGVMLDDLLAGFYANIILRILIFYGLFS